MSGFVQPDEGFYYPRIYRDNAPTGEDDWLKAVTATAVVLRLLTRDLERIFETVEPSACNMKAYGHRLRQHLIAACTEVEASWAAVLRANNYVRERPTTADYVKLADPLHLREYGADFAFHRDLGTVRPFAKWSDGKPTESLGWYHNYNATKHDREKNLDRATLEAAIAATAAVFLMAVVQFGDSPFIGLGTELGQSMFRGPWAPDLRGERYKYVSGQPLTPIPYPFPP